MSGLKNQSNQRSTKLSVAVRTIMLTLALAVTAANPSFALADGEKRSRSDAVEIAKERSGGNGRVLSVKKQSTDNGETVYAVKIINNGRVKVYTISETP